MKACAHEVPASWHPGVGVTTYQRVTQEDNGMIDWVDEPVPYLNELSR